MNLARIGAAVAAATVGWLAGGWLGAPGAATDAQGSSTDGPTRGSPRAEGPAGARGEACDPDEVARLEALVAALRAGALDAGEDAGAAAVVTVGRGLGAEVVHADCDATPCLVGLLRGPTELGEADPLRAQLRGQGGYRYQQDDIRLDDGRVLSLVAAFPPSRLAADDLEHARSRRETTLETLRGRSW